MRPTMDERRTAREAAWQILHDRLGKLDRARLGRRAILRSWWWRLLHGRSWARHVAACREAVRRAFADYRAEKAAADIEHAWLVLNNQVDRRLANWIRARRGQPAWTPYRPPPSETERAWAAYMSPGRDESGRRLPRDPALRPIPREEPRPVERMHAPGAPSPGVVILEGVIEGVEQEPDGSFVALHRRLDMTLERIVVSDAQARALAERLAAEKVSE